jgi:hypothetical protein
MEIAADETVIPEYKDVDTTLNERRSVVVTLFCRGNVKTA